MFLVPLILLAQSPSPRLIPGDRLRIVCADEPAFTVYRTVAPDGTVSLPFGLIVSLGGRSANEAADRVSDAIQRAGMGHLEFDVRLQPARGSAVTVSGAVSRRIELQYRHGVALSHLLKVSGVSDDANTDAVSIERSDGTSCVIPASWGFLVRDGDQVLVPFASASDNVTVVGGVASPNTIRFRNGLTLGEAIDAAGGLAPLGDGSRVVLTRQGERIPMSLPEDVGFVLRQGDSIMVSVRAERHFVAVHGDVAHPGLVELVPGMTVTRAIDAAGGPLHPTGEYVSLKSVEGKRYAPAWLSLAFMRSIRIPDPVLQPDDVIEVRQGAGKR